MNPNENYEVGTQKYESEQSFYHNLSVSMFLIEHISMSEEKLLPCNKDTRRNTSGKKAGFLYSCFS